MAIKGKNTVKVKSSEVIPVTGKVKKPPRKPLPKGLTEKQKAFCRQYIFDWNATRSYRETYPNVKNDNVAHAAAGRLLRNVTVQSYLADIQKDLEKLAGVSRLRVINEHMKIAFNSIAHLHNTWIERKEFEALTDEQKACIKSIESSVEEKNIGGMSAANQHFVEVETVKITLFDKQKALESISKMLGYDAPQKIEVTNPIHIVLTKEETKKISEQLENEY